MMLAQSLGRRFSTPHGEVVALADVDFKLHAGCMIVVEGPSGCGKSTLLNLVGGLDRASDGRLEIANTDIAALTEAALSRFRREHIGFLFQDAGLIDRMTVLDNIALPLEYRLGSRRQAVDSAWEALDRVDLRSRAEMRVEMLSGGERQRAGLARVLAIDPIVIVCDEPTASLDEINSRLVLQHLMAASARGSLVICASHDPIVLDGAENRITLARGRRVTEAA